MYQFIQVANSILAGKTDTFLPALKSWFLIWLVSTSFFSVTVAAQAQNNLPVLVQRLKPSVVAIAIYNPTASPRLKLLGSGFVINPGDQIVTNYHVISAALDPVKNESYVVLSGHGQQPKVHQVLTTRSSRQHDLALLKIDGQLPPVALASGDYVAEGTELAFTGYPITGVLGLYPATHSALLSAVTPVAIPVDNSQVISAATLKQLRDPFLIYQLDGTAYPGNSGSMLYNRESGEVVGIINMVLVKSSREAVLSDPSGISYAIPVKHLHQLIQQSAAGETR